MNIPRDILAATTNSRIFSDLAYTILDFLSESDKASFTAFSLVCRQWRDAGQHHLFRKFSISNTQRFVAFLGALPTMSLRIRVMLRELHLGPGGYPANWSINCTQVLCIMGWLPQVRTLIFKNMILNTSTIDPGILSLAPILLNALTFDRVYQSVDPRLVHRSTFRDIISFIGLFCGIQHLRISLNQYCAEPATNDYSHPAVALPPIPLPLRSLYLSAPANRSMLQYLHRAGAARSLRMIELESEGPFGALEDLLADEPSILESLTINKWTNLDGPDTMHVWSINSSSLIRLREFNIRVWQTHPIAGKHYHYRTFLLSTVEHFATAPIEIIRLTVYLNVGILSRPLLQGALSILRNFDWELIGRSLCRYRQLKDVTFEFIGGSSKDMDMTLIQRCMEDISERVLPRSRRADKSLRLKCHWYYCDESLEAGCITLARSA